jgi:polar amino acid transport system substrate-binding protein
VLVPTISPTKSIDELGGKRVCATTGSTSIDNIKARPSHPIPVPVPDWTDCLVLLQQGKVDAISTDDTILAGLAAQDPYVKVVGDPFTREPYGMAIRKDHPDFVRFVNGVLDQLRADGTWTAIYNRWAGRILGAPDHIPPALYSD